MASLKIGIIGAGVGGPAAAVGLARNGHHITLYGRSTDTIEVGFAFRITANSDRCLKYLGIDSVAGGAVSANVARQLTAGGRVIREIRENETKGARSPEPLSSRIEYDQRSGLYEPHG